LVFSRKAFAARHNQIFVAAWDRWIIAAESIRATLPVDVDFISSEIGEIRRLDFMKAIVTSPENFRERLILR